MRQVVSLLLLELALSFVVTWLNHLHHILVKKRILPIFLFATATNSSSEVTLADDRTRYSFLFYTWVLSSWPFYYLILCSKWLCLNVCAGGIYTGINLGLSTGREVLSSNKQVLLGMLLVKLLLVFWEYLVCVLQVVDEHLVCLWVYRLLILSTLSLRLALASWLLAHSQRNFLVFRDGFIGLQILLMVIMIF